MRNKKILQKAAKKSLSWLLILGMLVTLPETPGAISAAAAELETGTEENVKEENSTADVTTEKEENPVVEVEADTSENQKTKQRRQHQKQRRQKQKMWKHQKRRQKMWNQLTQKWLRMSLGQ